MTKPKDSSTAKNMTHHAGTWNGNDIEVCLADAVESRGKITLSATKDMTDAELVEAVNQYVWGNGYRVAKDGKIYGSYHGHGYETTREELVKCLMKLKV